MRLGSLGVLPLAETAGLTACATPSTSGQPPPAVEASSTGAADTVAQFLRSDGRFTIFLELMSSRNVPGHDTSFIDVVDAEADPDPANLVQLLDGIDGAWEDAQEGWRQAQAGDTIPLDQL